MIETYTLLQRFRIWLAELIGGSHLVYKVNMLEDAIRGWRRSNAELEKERDDLFNAIQGLEREIDNLVQSNRNP